MYDRFWRKFDGLPHGWRLGLLIFVAGLGLFFLELMKEFGKAKAPAGWIIGSTAGLIFSYGFFGAYLHWCAHYRRR